MKLKMDDAGHVVVSDGKPVYVADDGKEIAFDAPGTADTIKRLNAEAKSHREAKEAAEARLKTFDGITDPTAAIRALSTVSNLEAKKLVDAGEVEKVKAEAIKAVEERFAPVIAERDRLQGELYGEKIGGAFARSKFIGDKIAIPSDLMQARFGSQFEIKDGRVLAKDAAGNPIFSRARPGEYADFEEALEIMVDAYPQKASILKGTGGSGGGARPGSGGMLGSKSISSAEFSSLGAKERAAFMAGGGKLTD